MDLESYKLKQQNENNQQIAIDFDGVIHTNSKGYHDGTVYDPPFHGTEEALKQLSQKYKIVIFTCKVKPDRPLINGKSGKELIKEWLSKYNLLHYIHETCYIVSGGPSLKNYPPQYLKEKLKDKLVISVKQSFNILKEVVDFHVLNFTNFQPYDYRETDNIVVWEVFEQFHPEMILKNNLKCELMLPVVGNRESDIVKRIVTLGWDIGDISKFKGDKYEDVWQDHFYEDTPDKMAYAPTPMNFHEVNTVVNSTEYLNKWLLSKGVELNIISDRNPAHKSIPRIKL